MPDSPQVAAELRRAILRLNRRLRQQNTDSDLTPSQISALSTLYREGPLSAGDLASRERVRPPSVTPTINALQAAGFVSKNEHPTDGRQLVISISDAGRTRVEADVAARERWLSQQLSGLSAQDRETLAKAAVLINNLAQGN